MEEVYLTKPSLAFEKEILRYRDEFHKHDIPDHHVPGSNMLEHFNTVEAWLNNIKLSESYATLPDKKYVPSYAYILVKKSSNKILGMSNLRLELNDYLLNFAGNIGYSIAPSERRKDYGKVLLKKTLLEAKKMGLDRVLLTCDEENIASEKIIVNNNGIFENKLYDEDDNCKGYVKRFWIALI
ncbi:GNAT family N-acetyltransferase [Lactococcus piscium]|uniref:Acetyltransferase, GNAT family protein n=1 Tax=Pseudolactococcus piscium MKFS47 TaxID=297352 RepID=A0A0D6DVX2_9LACT|nr:GNAT family N-acetyltransferase [Lactococcus piscium]CEN27923.1 Acetyltransferase, GNAT family protein [Lactococcus piscium MKFS47]